MVSIAHVGKPLQQKAPGVLATALTTGNSAWTLWEREGARFVEISGTFDGATVTMFIRHKDRPAQEIQVQDKDGLAIEVTTAALPFFLTIPPSYEVQVRTSGGGASQSINVYVT